MRLPDSEIQLAKLVPHAQIRRQRFRTAVLHRFQRTLHHIAKHLAGNAPNGAINRLDVRLRDTLGVLQHRLSATLPNAAVEHDCLTHRQILHHPGLVEPDQWQPSRVVLKTGCDARKAVKAAETGLIGHDTHHHHLAAACLAAGRGMRPVLIALGQKIQQIAQ